MTGPTLSTSTLLERYGRLIAFSVALAVFLAMGAGLAAAEPEQDQAFENTTEAVAEEMTEESVDEVSEEQVTAEDETVVSGDIDPVGDLIQEQLDGLLADDFLDDPLADQPADDGDIVEPVGEDVGEVELPDL